MLPGVREEAIKEDLSEVVTIGLGWGRGSKDANELATLRGKEEHFRQRKQ